jgi:hypothetical protein
MEEDATYVGCFSSETMFVGKVRPAPLPHTHVHTLTPPSCRHIVRSGLFCGTSVFTLLDPRVCVCMCMSVYVCMYVCVCVMVLVLMKEYAGGSTGANYRVARYQAKQKGKR